MKKNKKILLLLLLFLFFTFNVSYADVGNINRYSNNSSSTPSNSSTYSGSGSSSSRNNTNTSSSSSGGSLSTLVIIGVVFLVVLYFYGKSKGMIKGYKDIADISKMKEVYNDFKNTTSDSSNSGVMGSNSDISKNDPNFSEEKFINWVNNVFIKLQMAWTNRDWKVIRPFESNELFEQHSAQLQEYINNNKINVMERISIVQSEIAGYEVEGDKEFLFVSLIANLRDYIIDANTKEILEGDKNKDYQMFYKMTFYRKLGVKTKEGTSNMSTTNCPNCGAPTEITSAGQCKYCDSVITTGEHDWVLSKIEGEPC